MATVSTVSTMDSLLEQLKAGTSSVLKLTSYEFEYGRYDLAPVEAAARGNLHITTLAVTCNDVTPETHIRFAPLVKALYASLPSVTTLKLASDTTDFVRFGYLQGSEHFTSISVKLENERDVFSRVPLGHALRHHTSLRSLSYLEKDVVFMPDLDILPSSLVDIHLGWVCCGSFDFLRSPALSSVSIVQIPLTDGVDWQAFARGLRQSNLRHLKIGITGLGQDTDTLVSILDAIENMTTLVSLDLKVARIGGNPPPVSLTKLIWPSRRLKELRVCSTLEFEPAITNEEIVDFAAGLAGPGCCLNRLQLEGGINPELVYTLLAELKRAPPTSLRHLSITAVDGPESDGSWERVDSLVGDIFALPFISITLALGQSAPKNAVSCLQGQTLVKKLQQNYTLNSLNTNLVDSDCLSRLQSICRLNAAGRGYLKTGNAASRSCGVEVLVKVKDDLDDLFTHIVENPSLCNRDYDAKSAGFCAN